MSQNQTLRHTARDAVKSAHKADSDNTAVNLLTRSALANLAGVKGASVEYRQQRVSEAVAYLNAAIILPGSEVAKTSLKEAVEALGQVTFPESSYVPPTYAFGSWEAFEDGDEDEEDDDEE
jgi:hypothetical protein